MIIVGVKVPLTVAPVKIAIPIGLSAWRRWRGRGLGNCRYGIGANIGNVDLSVGEVISGNVGIRADRDIGNYGLSARVNHRYCTHILIIDEESIVRRVVRRPGRALTNGNVGDHSVRAAIYHRHEA